MLEVLGGSLNVGLIMRIGNGYKSGIRDNTQVALVGLKNALEKWAKGDIQTGSISSLHCPIPGYVS